MAKRLTDEQLASFEQDSNETVRNLAQIMKLERQLYREENETLTKAVKQLTTDMEKTLERAAKAEHQAKKEEKEKKQLETLWTELSRLDFDPNDGGIASFAKTVMDVNYARERNAYLKQRVKKLEDAIKNSLVENPNTELEKALQE